VDHLQIAAKAKGGFAGPTLAATGAVDPTVGLLQLDERSRARSSRAGKRSAAHGKEHSGKKGKGRKLSR
jgi:hypothetical protein